VIISVVLGKDDQLLIIYLRYGVFLKNVMNLI
jgi:hypothetical protein